MREEAIWQAFRETGDPVCYLLYRAAEGMKERPEGRPPAAD